MRKNISKALIQLLLIMLSIVILLPFVYVILISLGRNVVGTNTVIPDELTLNNYIELLKNTNFLDWFKNSLIVSLFTMATAVVLVSLSVYVFSRLRFHGRTSLFNFILIIQIFPLTLSMVSIFHIFVQLNLINRLSGLVLINSVLSSAGLILLAKGYFDTIPFEIDEAAMMDGANKFTIITRITLPLAKPMIAIIAIQSFVISYNEYVIARIIMSEGLKNMPLAVGLQSMIMGQYNQNWSLYCAGAVLGSIPMLILFYSLQKYFIGGLTEGSVKS